MVIASVSSNWNENLATIPNRDVIFFEKKNHNMILQKLWFLKTGIFS